MTSRDKSLSQLDVPSNLVNCVSKATLNFIATYSARPQGFCDICNKKGFTKCNVFFLPLIFVRSLHVHRPK